MAHYELSETDAPLNNTVKPPPTLIRLYAENKYKRGKFDYARSAKHAVVA
jgi:hypothetical protein